MKKIGVYLVLFTAASLASISGARADILKDFDSLGGNDVLLERAQALNPESRVSIVQNRIVNRKLRFEFSPEFTRVLGGDAYLTTNSVGLNANFHITPKWSVGAKYGYMSNKLSTEGESLIYDTSVAGKAFIPDIDYPKQEYLGLIDFYPIYGKSNMMDAGIAHFDIYLLAGGGQIVLKSGPTTTWTAGGGVGFWISQHMTSRLELRYQSYTAKRLLGTTPMDLTVASLQLGYMP